MTAIRVNKPMDVDAKVVKVCAKVCDAGCYELVTSTGDTLRDHDGYVPAFFPGEHHGDYLLLDIDIETGRILNWQPPTRDALEAFVNGGDE